MDFNNDACKLNPLMIFLVGVFIMVMIIVYIYIFIFSKKPRDFSQDFFILYYDDE
jgi:hypothetical protein